MGKIVDFIVDNAPNLLKVLGVILILADGPLPFGDVFGAALIAYGSALGAAYKISDVATTIEGYFRDPGRDPNGHDATATLLMRPSLLPRRLGAPSMVASKRTKYLTDTKFYCNYYRPNERCNPQ